MKYLSVCSGIEAASVAWHPLGWEPLAFSEIEAFPRAVLEHHYPAVPLHGDFTVLKDQPWIVDADVLVGGTPCQAFSVAGLRNSLDDARGNLSLEFIRLADAIDAAREAQGRDPSVIVWENVPGVLSVKDNAFGCFLAGLAGDVDPYVPPRGKWTNAGVVAGPQRQVAWRVLDAQYFGLAQRRRRVFVVASARDGFDPAAVLLEFEGVRRDTPPRREKGQGSAASVIKGAAIGRKPDAGPQYGEHLADGTCYTLNCTEQHAVVTGQRSHWDGDFPHPTLNQSAKGSGGVGASNQELFSQRGAYLAPAHPVVMAHGQANAEIRTDGGTPALTCLHEAPIVAHSLRGEGFDASEDGTGRGTPLVPVNAYGFYQNQGSHGSGDNRELSPTLKAADSNNLAAAAIAFSYKDSGADAANDLSPTLRALGAYDANGGGQMAVAIPFDTTQITSPSNYSRPKEGDPCHPLAAGAHPPAVAFAQNTRDEVRLQGGDGQIVGALAAQPGMKQTTYVAEPYTLAIRGRGDTHNLEARQDGLANALLTPNGGRAGIGVGAVAAGMAVRRLTPVECERLQGFPDDYTAIPWKKKPADQCPDGPRYKALGNSMAVPVMRWIGKRIAEALR